MGLTTTSQSPVHLYESLLPLVMAKFGTDYFTIGIIVSVFSYDFGLGSLPAGILADKTGPHCLASLYLFGAGTMGVLVLLSAFLLIYGKYHGIDGCVL